MPYLTTVKILDFFEKVNFWPLLLLLPLLGGIAGLGGSRQIVLTLPSLTPPLLQRAQMTT